MTQNRNTSIWHPCLKGIANLLPLAEAALKAQARENPKEAWGHVPEFVIEELIQCLWTTKNITWLSEHPLREGSPFNIGDLMQALEELHHST